MSKRLKRSFINALVFLLIALFVMVTSTFAWYIYNTNARTTKVHMAAGSSSNLQISNEKETGYRTKTVLKAFTGNLNPVSTDNILNGFQKVYGFTNGSENQSNLVANLFGTTESTDYYQTSLYVRTKGSDCDVYVSDIGFDDSDEDHPISAAIRVGIVAYDPEDLTQVVGQYIFEINDEVTSYRQYNTQKGYEGHVLDSTKTDGSTVPYTPLDSKNYCNYDETNGEVSITDKSIKICDLKTAEDDYGKPAKLDIYIWLEGCDGDCVNELLNTPTNIVTLKNVALSFAAVNKE